MTTFTGTLPTPADGLRILGADIAALANALHALADPWTDFSSSVGWTSSGTAPAIGNGSISASYLQVGQFVAYKGRITAGSTTSFGSANAWQVNLPVVPLSTIGVGAAWTYHSSVATSKLPAIISFAGGAAGFFSTGGPVAATVPFTWASADLLGWDVVYEAA